MAGKRTCACCGAEFPKATGALGAQGIYTVQRCKDCGSASYREENVTDAEIQAQALADKARDDAYEAKLLGHDPSNAPMHDDAWPSRQ